MRNTGTHTLFEPHRKPPIRFAVRVKDSYILTLTRAARMAQLSPDMFLTGLVDRHLTALQNNGSGDSGSSSRLKTAVAKWKNTCLSDVQLRLYRTLLAFETDDQVASSEGRVFCVSNVELAEASGFLTNQKLRNHITALLKKGLISRVFFRNVEAPDGRTIREQYVYVIHADPADVVVL